ncbi:MAG: GvpL/GvpF family gas vesicle protein [Chloroflexota bacterium]
MATLEDGCYLYGVTAISSEDREPILTGMAPLDIVEAPFDLGLDHARVYLLKRGNLAAVVGLVPLADFSAEALQARLGDPSMLRLAVQMHNDVIHAIHQQQTILPARFGAVYANLDDVTAEIDRRSDALRAQLSWLDGCDEWAVHISVDQQAVRAAILADQALDPVHQQLATVSPGRAYLLGRKWEEGLAAKTAQAGDELALAAYQRLASLAVDGIPTRPVSSSGNPDGEAEVLRAAFLVRRERAEDFVSAVRECGETERGYQCTCSGPWPPYSFVATTERDDDERQDA